MTADELSNNIINSVRKTKLDEVIIANNYWVFTEKYEKVLGGSGGVDVTGGMKHKVEEALELAKKGIPGLIIDGVVNGSLAQAVKGGKVLGTRIEW